MLCCSSTCTKYDKCHYAVKNNPNRIDNIEPFDSFGSASYTYNSKTNEVEILNNTMCHNYSMFISIDNEEDKEMNDNLRVTVEISDYNKYEDKPFPVVKIKSVFENDELVIIEGENGLSVKVGASELTKAIGCCSHNRW